ncbi:hypothetical protein GQ53DRAFT_552429 [Thozetella sp. PMI_491]|nr:hypothetical protein GQ53DRAFT_552429 [Thozetella sp. PMI_491]
METLTTLPLRPDGVRPTLEFVFAVHPTSTVKNSEAAAPQKRGANVTNESLNMATRLLSTPPSTVTAEDWFTGVGPQLLQLLDEGDADLRKVVAYVVGFGVLGNRKLGSPGTPGWTHLAEPMLNAIKPPAKKYGDVLDSDSIIDLSREHVIVSPDDLAKALRRLLSLLNSHPNPGLCKRLISRLLSPLWALSSWPKPSPQSSENYCAPAKELLKTFLRLETAPDVLVVLIEKLTYLGGHEKDKPEWLFQESVDGRPQVVAVRTIGGSTPGVGQLTLEDIDSKVSTFVEILDEVSPDGNISSVFLDLFRRWIASGSKVRTNSILIKDQDEDKRDPMEQLVEVKVLQAMMDKFPDKLASQPVHLLQLVSQVLGYDGQADEDEATSVALSLLNMVVTVPGFQMSLVDNEIMQPIQTALDRLSKAENEDVSRTAQNLALLLKYRDELDDPADVQTAPTDRQVEDRKTYRLAVSYITQPESPPPVKAEGLNLISTLISSLNPILDIPGILVLMSSLLKNDDDYINLKVIKIFTLLVDRHPKSVTKELLDHYVDPKELASVDTRLRFGEALLQVIERLGETFTGEVAQQVGEALLSVASRRGHRAKTAAKQAREERAHQLKKKEADEVWGGEVPDMSEPMNEEEKAREAILSQIVEGWESKRGTEDIRIRSSALSVFAAGVETSIAGLGPTLVSAAVDLSMNILQLERELEKGILRRSAVLLVLSFVHALDHARQSGRKLGFGLASQEDVVRVLQFVADTDNDGLVQQHARDVIESLENWTLTRLVPETTGPGIDNGLTRLAGLTINPGLASKQSDGPRPRIEEIE